VGVLFFGWTNGEYVRVARAAALRCGGRGRMEETSARPPSRGRFLLRGVGTARLVRDGQGGAVGLIIKINTCTPVCALSNFSLFLVSLIFIAARFARGGRYIFISIVELFPLLPYTSPAKSRPLCPFPPIFGLPPDFFCQRRLPLIIGRALH